MFFCEKAVFKQRQQADAWRIAAVVCLFGGNGANAFIGFREIPRIWMGTIPAKTSFCKTIVWKKEWINTVSTVCRLLVS